MAGSRLDVFQFCACLRVVGNVMLLVVLGLVGLVYCTLALVHGPAVLHGNVVDRVLGLFILITEGSLVRCVL